VTWSQDCIYIKKDIFIFFREKNVIVLAIMMQAIPVQCHRKLVMQLFSGLTKSNASVRAWKTTCLCSAVRFGDRPNFLCMLTLFFLRQNRDRMVTRHHIYITLAATVMSSFYFNAYYLCFTVLFGFIFLFGFSVS
jgi:hypothetical protein